MQHLYRRIDQDPRFHALARQRSRLGWTLAALVLGAYHGFIFCIAWRPAWLAETLAPGTALTVGLAWGLGVMVLGIGLTGIYVHRANSAFDRLNAEILQDATRHE